jgi:hypothetical protein
LEWALQSLRLQQPLIGEIVEDVSVLELCYARLKAMCMYFFQRHSAVIPKTHNHPVRDLSVGDSRPLLVSAADPGHGHDLCNEERCNHRAVNVRPNDSLNVCPEVDDEARRLCGAGHSWGELHLVHKRQFDGFWFVVWYVVVFHDRLSKMW